MIVLNHIKKISENEWLIPQKYRHDMLADVRIFATEKLLRSASQDLSLEQAVNATTLPGIINPMMVMPDVHQGYGFPIGGVAAIRADGGVISPGAIGYDINCGVRLMASSIEYDQARDQLPAMATALNQYCPSGVGVEGNIKINKKELEDICRIGAGWAIKKGMASDDDVRRTEESGEMPNGSAENISKKAIERGLPQLGTLGAGNHFIEVDLVDKIIDEKAATVMGLYQGCLVVQIHCGSRGFGHQICTDFVQQFLNSFRKWGSELPDRELVYAPLDSTEGKAYFDAMQAAANYAFCNRQLLAYFARQAFIEVFAVKTNNFHLRQVYDIAHNMGKMESYRIDQKDTKVCIHRKGATRALGPGAPGLPLEYSKTGQPILVPGSMGTDSWVLVGSEKSKSISWGSCCHGAGRMMSRSKARHLVRGERLKAELEGEGITIRAGSMAGLAEEAPRAYKDVDEIVEVVCQAGIASKVAHLRPVAVIKG